MSPRSFSTYMTRRTMYHAQGGRCHICGNDLSNRFASPLLTIDHVWPRSWSRAQEKLLGNALLAHSRCNGAKGSRQPTGCEIIQLFAANRAMGFAEAETARWDAVSYLPGRAA